MAKTVEASVSNKPTYIMAAIKYSHHTQTLPLYLSHK